MGEPNVVDIPGANIQFDVDWGMQKLGDFNRNAFWVASDRMLRELFREPVRGQAKALVQAVDALMHTRVPEDARECLSEVITGTWEAIFALREEIEAQHLRDNPQGTWDRAAPILGRLLNIDGIDRHYSFATKFLHWASCGRLPIVDSRARRSIRGQQQAYRQAGHPWRDDTRLLREAGVDRCEDYKKWVFFYSRLLQGLAEHEAGLREQDLHTQLEAVQDGENLVLGDNTLLRVLDKIFWIAGHAE